MDTVGKSEIREGKTQGVSLNSFVSYPRRTRVAEIAPHIARVFNHLHKAGRQSVTDPVTGESVQLFNPILQTWPEHFRFSGYQIEGLTPEGRATVEALNLNHPRRQRIREVEEAFGFYPPVQ